MNNKHMENFDNKKSIKGKILDQIKAGETKMKPKWHFILKTILFIIGTIVIAFTVLYLASFIIFMLYQNGNLFVTAFGFRGIWAFLTSLPWLLIMLAAIFIVVLEFMVKHYSFAYRKPLVYSALGVIILGIFGTIVVMQTGFHQRIFEYTEEREFPFARGLYHNYGMQHLDSIHIGIIEEINEDGFILINYRGEILKVLITVNTRFPYGIDFAVGDKVSVLGDRDDDIIEAIGVRRVDDLPHQGQPVMPGWGMPMMP